MRSPKLHERFERKRRRPTRGKRQVLADPILARYAKQIRGLAKRSVGDIIKIGAVLTKAKKRAGHGGYLSWLDREFGWSVDTAQNFVNVFEFSRTAKFRKFRNLPTSALYLLVKKSTPEAARISITARAEAGELIRIGDVRREIQHARPVTLSVLPQPANELPKITTEDLQAGLRRSLVDLIVDVAGQLPRDQSFEEARAVVESIGTEAMRERFSEAVAKLNEFVGQLQRALNERRIKAPPARKLRVIPGKDD